MKILIVSTFFPPTNSIASLRPYSWAKYWSKMGHEVTVLTTKKNQHETDLKLDCSMFRIVEVPLWIPFANVYRNEKKIIINQDNLNIKQILLKQIKRLYDIFTQKTGCFLTCRYPDWNDYWAKKALQFVAEHQWDLVVSTGGPYSVHRVGYFLKKKKWTKKWVIDWRDLWTKNHIYKGFPLFHPLEKYLEKIFHNNADLITAVSEPLAYALRQMTRTPVEIIYNGFDSDDFIDLLRRPRKDNNRLEIVYTGTIYRPYQDPSPFFEALSQLIKQGYITKKDVHITFAGNQADVSDLAQQHNIIDSYTFAGFLPRNKALEMQYDADIVLFLEFEKQGVEGVLTGKLFEYLFIAREIWGIGCSNTTEPGSLIEKSNSGIAFGKDIEKIKAYIMKRINNKSFFENKKNYNIIHNYERKMQAEIMLQKIFQIKCS
jgi:glycosyltransferase involved in cell wall biosynthesis